MKSKKILVWFRNDLRLHDNEMLAEAVVKSDFILPVYFFDPRHFDRHQAYKSGLLWSQFLIESISSLRKKLQSLEGDLLIVQGKPEDLIPELVEKFEITEVYHHREVAPAETQISANVEDRLWKNKINLKHFIGHTLYNKEDLPFPIKDIPDVFTQFKKKTERDAIVKPCIEIPEQISFVDNDDWGDIPTLTALFPESSFNDGLDKYVYTGGEDAGLKHLNEILSEEALIYKKTKTSDRNRYNSRLSAWLSLGCLSPRKVYWSVKAAEECYGSNPNFNHLILGLLWRDYYRFMFKKHGAGYLTDGVLENELKSDLQQELLFEGWKRGNTGHNLIDGYMEELNRTGFLPHNARILVAVFLVHVLKINWMKGAAYFEERLIDYTTASNWGNWASIADSDKDNKSKHSFDVQKQLKLLQTAPLVS